MMAHIDGKVGKVWDLQAERHRRRMRRERIGIGLLLLGVLAVWGFFAGVMLSGVFE